MPTMFVTPEVSKEERSRDARDEQPSNIPRMLVTPEVSTAPKSIDVKLQQPENI